jgi:serine/threonine protein kinase
MDESNQRHYSPSDFVYGPTIGEGRFGTVIYAELKPAKQDPTAVADTSSQHLSRGYAMKVIPKSEIFRHNQLRAVLMEKHILCEVLSSRAENPSELFMKLFLCFHDASFVYFVLELCAGGTLLSLIQSCASNSINSESPVMCVSWVEYYSGQLLRAIEYLHQRGVVHRDLSPQNIALTFPNGEIKLGDFGGAAILTAHEHEGELRMWVPTGSPPGQSSDFVGNPDYASPEMIRGSNDDDTLSPSMDIWSFGCLVYHMSVGESPFHAASDHLAVQRVLDFANRKMEICFPPSINEAAKDLISLLLSIDPASRLGMQDGVIESNNTCHSTEIGQKRYISIRNHSFFHTNEDTTIWMSLESKTKEPPYKPAQPKWMADLHSGDDTLESFESIRFDL